MVCVKAPEVSRLSPRHSADSQVQQEEAGFHFQEGITPFAIPDRKEM